MRALGKGLAWLTLIGAWLGGLAYSLAQYPDITRGTLEYLYLANTVASTGRVPPRDRPPDTLPVCDSDFALNAVQQAFIDGASMVHEKIKIGGMRDIAETYVSRRARICQAQFAVSTGQFGLLTYSLKLYGPDLVISVHADWY